MNGMQELLSKTGISYLVVINVLAFLLFGVDKMRAKRNEWRIPESTLLVAALFGGSLGSWAGMRVFHHKTRKPKFTILIPAMLLAQMALLAYLGVKL